MTGETLLTLVLGVIGGGAGAQLVQWLRYRSKDKADTTKTIHDSQAQALTVSSALLAQWIADASTAQQRIGELITTISNKDVTINEKDFQLREAWNAVGLCKASLERCRQQHGCGQ